MSRQKIKLTRKIKGKYLLERKIKEDLETENTINSQMHQIVIVTKIHHQRTQILTMVQHQNFQRKICPWMIIPQQASLTSLLQKEINGNLAKN